MRVLQSVLFLQQPYNCRSKFIQALKLKPHTIQSHVPNVNTHRTGLRLTAVPRAVFNRMQQKGLRGKLALEDRGNRGRHLSHASHQNGTYLQLFPATEQSTAFMRGGSLFRLTSAVPPVRNFLTV